MDTAKKHAYLIIAHNNLNLLKKNIKLIDNPYNDIYIHIDKKSSISVDELKLIPKYSKIFVYKEIATYWGDFSQIQVEIFLLKESTKISYQYYHLLSGVDMPLKSQKYIHDFFNKNYGKEFIHFQAQSILSEKVKWIKYYHLLIKFSKLTKIKCFNNIIAKLNDILIFLQMLMGIDRCKGKMIFQSGANWFSITEDLAKYVLSKEKWIYKHFKYTRSGDEIFLQTIVINSDFRYNLYNLEFNDDYKACMRYIDWKRGDPYVFQEDDYDLLINSEYLWARKFDEKKDSKIIDKIYNNIIELQKNISAMDEI